MLSVSDKTYPKSLKSMKEVTFIRRNIEKWKETEKVVEQAATLSPDQLADAYTELTADLAFAQTHFPTSRITIYLNNLASALHNEIYRSKREKWTRIITFWTQEVPQTMYDARRELLTSFIIFAVCMLIGAVSAANDSEFVRLILGNRYVDMTLDNIARGEPMAVYNGSPEAPMFLGITINNVRVFFLCFASGILTSFGTGFILLQNGIMVGAFQTFFYEHGLLKEAALAIWLHGTLEIWSIIVAGAAGLALGNGWLFPGTYSRLESFRRGAKRGLKIVIGTVPVFIMAGFIEGFITRHTELPDMLRLGIILTSLAFKRELETVVEVHYLSAFAGKPYSGIELERADGRSAENICSGQYYCHGCQSEFLSGIHVLLRSIYACLYDRDYLIDFLDLCNDPDL